MICSKDARSAADLGIKIGRWYGDKLGQPDYAVTSLQQALALVPDHADAQGALAFVQRKAGRFEEAAQALARQADLEADAEVKARVLLDLADLYE